MPPSTRIPPLLQSCVHLPRDDALVLVTSTLGATVNWLLVRHVCDALNASNASTAADGGPEDEGHNVVLVSWMREYEFWKHEARKGAGLDLERARREGRFAFVDGLSGLCIAPATDEVGPSVPSAREPSGLPARRPPATTTIPARGPRMPAAPVSNTADPSEPTLGLHTLRALDLAHLQTTITAAISGLASASPPSPTRRKTLVVIDNPDLFLAMSPAVTHSAMASFVLTLHTFPTVSHIITHIQADTPLLSLSMPPQPLELQHHNMLVKLAHMSSRVVGVRVLDTGVARDVSGVLRVTEQRVGWLNLGLDVGMDGEEAGKGSEFLYQVKGDGSVRVFERGAGGEG
ncbi:hypothetical protein NX059_005673 [Plenodomus lindquistii]|nr:hypothetical protein NX059_005673 [Plenodomus lindquistii]